MKKFLAILGGLMVVGLAWAGPANTNIANWYPKTGTILTYIDATGGVFATTFNGAMSGSYLTAGSVTAAKLDSTIVTNVLAEGMSLPAVNAYAATNFNGTNIVVGTVGLDKMMTDSVGDLQIINGSVSNSALGLGCISNKNLIASSITTTNIIDGAILLADMAADSVGNLQVIAGSISNANIGAGAAIAMTKLATNSVRSANNTLMVDRGNAVCWTGLTSTQTFHTAFAEAPEVMVRYTADGGNTNMVLTVVSNQFTVAAITSFSWIAVGWTSP